MTSLLIFSFIVVQINWMICIYYINGNARHRRWPLYFISTIHNWMQFLYRNDLFGFSGFLDWQQKYVRRFSLFFFSFCNFPIATVAVAGHIPSHFRRPAHCVLIDMHCEWERAPFFYCSVQCFCVWCFASVIISGSLFSITVLCAETWETMRIERRLEIYVLMLERKSAAMNGIGFSERCAVWEFIKRFDMDMVTTIQHRFRWMSAAEIIETSVLLIRMEILGDDSRNEIGIFACFNSSHFRRSSLPFSASAALQLQHPIQTPYPVVIETLNQIKTNTNTNTVQPTPPSPPHRLLKCHSSDTHQSPFSDACAKPPRRSALKHTHRVHRFSLDR